MPRYARPGLKVKRNVRRVADIWSATGIADVMWFTTKKKEKVARKIKRLGLKQIDHLFVRKE